MSGQVAVLIPAGGKGRRLGGTRKQFRCLGEEYLFVQTLRVFDRHPEIDKVILSVPADAPYVLDTELRRVGLSKLVAVVTGGSTRQESVYAALQATPQEVDMVLIHDAVRPFVTPADISGIVQSVRSSGAAALGLPVADSMRYGVEGVFGETITREGLYRMQTPQGFRRDWLEEAFVQAEKRDIVTTDDVELVQSTGRCVKIIPGSAYNIKITTVEDWEQAQLFWPYWEAQQVAGNSVSAFT